MLFDIYGYFNQSRVSKQIVKRLLFLFPIAILRDSLIVEIQKILLQLGTTTTTTTKKKSLKKILFLAFIYLFIYLFCYQFHKMQTNVM